MSSTSVEDQDSDESAAIVKDDSGDASSDQVDRNRGESLKEDAETTKTIEP